MSKSVAISKNKRLGERKSKVVSKDDNMMDLQILNDQAQQESSSSDYSLQADQDYKFSNLDFILSQKDYNEVHGDYEEAIEKQMSWDYIIKNYLSENILTKYFCCCMK